MSPGKVFNILLGVMIAGIAVALIFVACAALAQERHGWGHGDRGGSGGGYGGERHYEAYRRPGYRYDPGRGWWNPSAAIGGAVGGWLYRQWAQPEPEPVRGMEWCMNRYKSYDPYTKTYLGYDGLRHGCP